MACFGCARVVNTPKISTFTLYKISEQEMCSRDLKALFGFLFYYYWKPFWIGFQEWRKFLECTLVFLKLILSSVTF